MKHNDGGPAYPGPSYLRGSAGQLYQEGQHDGMSLRDYFAAAYTPTEADVIEMCEIQFSQVPAGCGEWPMWCKREARAALRYMEADSMLKERKNRANSP